VARQVYVFATAARRGWLPRADALVEHGLAFLRERLRRSDGRTVHAAVHVDGRVARGGFDLYEHAFVLFALAEACRGRPDRDGLRTEALALLEGLRDEWSHPVAGFVDDAMRAGVMLANPHMHLLEAALAWSQISTGPSQRAWDHLADELVQLCLARCIDAGDGALSERFDADWRAAQGPLARLIEPGHQFEWAWLLLRWARMRRTRDAVDAAEQLLRVGEGCGVDAERGVAVNALGGDLGIADPRAKLWPQTERIKAWSEAHAQGLSWAGGGAQAPLARAVRGLSKFFLDQPRGLWREEMHADGSFAPEPCKASSLYHIVCAVDALHDLHDGALPSPIGGAP
jgi:mannose-6-phosphate isomerase